MSKVTWQKTASPLCHLSWRQMDSSDLDPHLVHGFLGQHQSTPKRHLDQFSRFCTAHPYAVHTDTDRHTDRVRCDVCSNGLISCNACRPCGLKGRPLLYDYNPLYSAFNMALSLCLLTVDQAQRLLCITCVLYL